jgi:hypothetical protein
MTKLEWFGCSLLLVLAALIVLRELARRHCLIKVVISGIEGKMDEVVYIKKADFDTEFRNKYILPVWDGRDRLHFVEKRKRRLALQRMHTPWSPPSDMFSAPAVCVYDVTISSGRDNMDHVWGCISDYRKPSNYGHMLVGFGYSTA